MKIKYMVSAVILLVSSSATLAFSKPEYTVQTKKACVYCHYRVEGGGELRPTGYNYKEAGYRLKDYNPPPAPFKQYLHLIIGFLHVLSAVIWFGVIFYIHIFIRPDSLTHGLPRSEIKLGWTCIVLVFITGAALSLFRLHSIDEITQSTFGFVWAIKVSIFFLMVMVAAFVTTRLNRKLKQIDLAKEKEGDVSGVGERDTISTIVFQGDEYDVSESRLWKGGIHMKRHHAGEDLTEAIKDAPHGPEVLERVTKTGAATFELSRNIDERPAMLFKVLAYLNLFFIIAVLMCVSYWNWGPPLMFLMHNG